MENEDTRPAFAGTKRFTPIFDRVEAIYLRVLRITILLIATLLILYTAYLAISGLYRVAQSPASVKEATANVTANEITEAEALESPAADADKGPTTDAAQQKFYADFAKRYYALFRTKFEPFRQAEDKTLSLDEFDDNFVQSNRRLQAATAGEISFAKDSADLESLFATMTSAASEPKVMQRLQRYKSAKKVSVKREAHKTRTEYRRGWNSLSTNCEDWYYSPIGCAEQRAVQVPYTVTVAAMEFPKGTQSYSQVFRAMQDRYFSLLEKRRADNAADADLRRTKIAIGNVEGAAALDTALRIFGGFLALMFFFLLIAIERHQRRIAATVRIEADSDSRNAQESQRDG